MRELCDVRSVPISINMGVSSKEESVELQCESSEFAYKSGLSCDETYAKLYRSYQQNFNKIKTILVDWTSFVNLSSCFYQLVSLSVYIFKTVKKNWKQ